MLPPQRHEMLSSYYRAADVCVVPSHSESFGLVALEAAACGVPVVAAAVGGLTTLVDDGRTGFLVEGRDPADYAAPGRHPRRSRPGRPPRAGRGHTGPGPTPGRRRPGALVPGRGPDVLGAGRLRVDGAERAPRQLARPLPCPGRAGTLALPSPRGHLGVRFVRGSTNLPLARALGPAAPVRPAGSATARVCRPWPQARDR